MSSSEYVVVPRAALETVLRRVHGDGCRWAKGSDDDASPVQSVARAKADLAAASPPTPRLGGEPVAWRWEEVESAARKYVVAIYGDYKCEATLGHGGDGWSAKVNNGGVLHLQDEAAAKSWCEKRVLADIDKRIAAAHETLRLYASPTSGENGVREALAWAKDMLDRGLLDSRKDDEHLRALLAALSASPAGGVPQWASEGLHTIGQLPDGKVIR